MSLPLITTSFLLSFILSQSSAQNTYWNHSSPLKKDYTNLYTITIYLKTPLQSSKLHLDLGSYLPWYDCSRHYKSSSYQPVIRNSSLCLGIDSTISGNCFDKPGPGCANDTCDFFTQNPVTLKRGTASIFTDKFALQNNTSPMQPGPVSQLAFACTDPNENSKIYRGLAIGSTGLASLGWFNYSLSSQITRNFASPWIFALCLPSASWATGIVWFRDGPYIFYKIPDTSKLLTYTGLIRGPRGAKKKQMYWYESPDYYIGLASFRVANRVVRLNQTLLAIDELGHGGTLISTSTPYTLLQSSIYKALTDAFIEESAKLNLKPYLPVEPFSIEPFSVCFEADKVPTTTIGPTVPTVDLVFPSSKNSWRIYGFNSMVRVQNLGADAWCWGFLDGGPSPETAIVIGGHQIEDTLMQFDLERQRVGFSSSLLLEGSSCSDWEFSG